MGSTGSSVDYTPYYDGGSQMTIPMFQPHVKIVGKEQGLEKIMRQKAAEGHLMIESNDLKAFTGEGTDFFTQCETMGIIHKIERQFGYQKQVLYYCLKLEVISLESIIWCLRSLKSDEMTPNEKAIQSRIKEAFSYKVSNRLWDKIMESIKNNSKLKTVQHNHAGSNPQSSSYFQKYHKNSRYQNLRGSEDYDAEHLKMYGPLTTQNTRNLGMPKTGGSMSRTQTDIKYIPTRSGKKLYHVSQDFQNNEKILFELEEDISSMECNTNTMEPKTYLIYPQGDTWVGVDGKNSQVDPVVYKEFIRFLEEYFTGDLEEFWDKYCPQICASENINPNRIVKSKQQRNSTESVEMNPIGIKNSTFDENTRAIPGGRYGCAQFVKTCGTPILRNLSLGMTSQLIQKAIGEDVLRYQKKTLLVWTASIDKDITCGLYTQEEIIK